MADDQGKYAAENDLLQPIGRSRIVGDETPLFDEGTHKAAMADSQYGQGRSIRYLHHDDEGSPIGAMQIRTHGPRTKKATIQNVYVAEHARRQGIASKMLARARQDFDVRHSDDLTTSGKAFARAVKADGGPVDEGEDHQHWIPTRLVTSKKAPSERSHIVDMPSFKSTPALYQKNTDLLRAYPNMRASIAGKSHDAVTQEMIRHAKENLLDLHDRVPEAVRNRSKTWYDGANRIAKQWAGEYGLPIHSVAGAMAALSPQRDWYKNVSLAHRVLESMRGDPGFYENHKFDPKMEGAWKARKALDRPEYTTLVGMLRGRSLHDLDQLGLPDAERGIAKAMWIRMHDEAYRDQTHRLVTPEGNFGNHVLNDDGTRAGTGWGSLNEISKAVRSIESADKPEAISRLMGGKHKVRNFYNNIISPNSRHGDVTIDTHAVAAALMRPLSGTALEVSHNFGTHPGVGLPAAGGSAITGIQGTYPVFAESYRQAAKERGIKPREMQSITWEAIRGLFPDTFKNKANNAKVDAVWNLYRQGRLSQAEAREKIHGIAGGIRNPTWLAGADEADRRPDDTGSLPQPGVHGRPSEGTVGGGGSGFAAPVQEESRVAFPRSLQLQRASGGTARQESGTTQKPASSRSIVDQALQLARGAAR